MLNNKRALVKALTEYLGKWTLRKCTLVEDFFKYLVFRQRLSSILLFSFCYHVVYVRLYIASFPYELIKYAFCKFLLLSYSLFYYRLSCLISDIL